MHSNDYPGVPKAVKESKDLDKDVFPELEPSI
jgi:hypothetical protein